MKPPSYTNATTANGLLNAVIRVTKEDFRRIHMAYVCVRGSSLEVEYNIKIKPPCGAAGCIAGWVLMLAGLTHPNELNLGDTRYAANILGLSAQQTQELFYPRELVNSREAQTVKYANAVIQHIRAFQNKYRKQLLATKLK